MFGCFDVVMAPEWGRRKAGPFDEKQDCGIDAVLFIFAEPVPPVFKFIRKLDAPFHRTHIR
jgi:hypothetical protein